MMESHMDAVAVEISRECGPSDIPLRLGAVHNTCRTSIEPKSEFFAAKECQQKLQAQQN
jgi:hypothetical protein